MARFFRHRAKPDWGVGRLVEEAEDRLRLAFEDGQTRTLLKNVPKLEEVPEDKVAKDSVARQATPKEEALRAQDPVESKIAGLDTLHLIRATRSALRNTLNTLLKEGLVSNEERDEGVEGIGRIASDWARMSGARADKERTETGIELKALLLDHGLEAIMRELSERLDRVPFEQWEGRTRVFTTPEDASDSITRLTQLVVRSDELGEDEARELVRLLTPVDLE